MAHRFTSWRALEKVGMVIILLTAGMAAAQGFRVDAVPVGRRPVGVAAKFGSNVLQLSAPFYVAVANSGDNSVSLFEVRIDPQTRRKSISLRTTVRDVAAPYGVAFCGPDLEGILVASSPSTNSLVVLDFLQGIVLRTIEVGPQPYSVYCAGKRAVASNFGDSTLAVVDLTSFTVIARIPDVPGSRGWRGVTAGIIAWVAGTEADVVTVLDLTTFRVLARLPVRRPTALRGTAVASELDNNITWYAGETLQVLERIENIPAPQDFSSSSFLSGWVATTKDGRLVVRGFQDSKVLSTIPGISGAAALTGVAWAIRPSPGLEAILVTSPETNNLYFLQQEAVASPPSEFQLSNAAAFSLGGTFNLAPGSLASAFANTGVSQPFFASTLPLPTRLGGVTLRVGGTLEFVNSRWVYSGGTAAPMLFVGPTQVNFQAPPGISPGDQIAQLERSDGATQLTTFRVAPTAPGIFTVLANGQGQAAALNQDNFPNGDPQRLVGVRPAPRGSAIQIFATGAGATNPPLAAGEAAPASGSPLVLTQVQPTVTIGGKSARVLFSGLAPGFVGLWQINAEVPQDVTPGTSVPMTVTAGGVTSNAVTIAVQ